MIWWWFCLIDDQWIEKREEIIRALQMCDTEQILRILFICKLRNNRSVLQEAIWMIKQHSLDSIYWLIIQSFKRKEYGMFYTEWSIFFRTNERNKNVLMVFDFIELFSRIRNGSVVVWACLCGSTFENVKWKMRLNDNTSRDVFLLEKHQTHGFDLLCMRVNVCVCVLNYGYRNTTIKTYESGRRKHKIEIEYEMNAKATWKRTLGKGLFSTRVARNTQRPVDTENIVSLTLFYGKPEKLFQNTSLCSAFWLFYGLVLELTSCLCFPLEFSVSDRKFPNFLHQERTALPSMMTEKVETSYKLRIPKKAIMWAPSFLMFPMIFKVWISNHW